MLHINVAYTMLITCQRRRTRNTDVTEANMADPKDDTEKAVALALIKSGYPVLAVMIVAAKRAPRIICAISFAVGCVAAGQNETMIKAATALAKASL